MKSLRFDLDIMLLVIRTQIDDKGFQFVTAVLKCPRVYPVCTMFC